MKNDFSKMINFRIDLLKRKLDSMESGGCIDDLRNDLEDLEIELSEFISLVDDIIIYDRT